MNTTVPCHVACDPTEEGLALDASRSRASTRVLEVKSRELLSTKLKYPTLPCRVCGELLGDVEKVAIVVLETAGNKGTPTETATMGQPTAPLTAAQEATYRRRQT